MRQSPPLYLKKTWRERSRVASNCKDHCGSRTSTRTQYDLQRKRCAKRYRPSSATPCSEQQRPLPPEQLTQRPPRGTRWWQGDAQAGRRQPSSILPHRSPRRPHARNVLAPPLVESVKRGSNSYCERNSLQANKRTPPIVATARTSGTV